MEQTIPVDKLTDLPLCPFRKIQIIINPAAGTDRPILGILNRAFCTTGTEWDVSITHKAGDGQRLAKEAIAAGCDLIAAYGGDGTVMEVACALQNTGIPLAIFPGGTGNAVAGELGISVDLNTAVSLVTGGNFDLQMVDLGKANDKMFVLRVAIGFEADMVKNTAPELKNSLGRLAYAVSAISELANVKQFRYKLTVDGETSEVDGITCIIANSSTMSFNGFKLSPKINVSDGLLDVVVFNNANLSTILSVTSNILTGGDTTELSGLHHRQGREITVDTGESQTIDVDGEFILTLPVTACVLPGVLKVIVPKRGQLVE